MGVKLHGRSLHFASIAAPPVQGGASFLMYGILRRRQPRKMPGAAGRRQVALTPTMIYDVPPLLQMQEIQPRKLGDTCPGPGTRFARKRSPPFLPETDAMDTPTNTRREF